MKPSDIRICLKAAICAICFIGASSTGFAFEHGTAVRQIINWQNLPDAYKNFPGTFKKSHSFQTLARCWQNHTFGDVKFKSAFEISFYYSQNTTNASFNSKKGYRTKSFDTSARLLSRSNTAVDFDLERLEFSFTTGIYDFQAGRQPISLGTSHFVSILDIIAPFHPGYLDSSYKPGVDAIRIRTFAGETGEMELIGIKSPINGHDGLLARYRNTFSGFDLELVGGRFRKRNFLGLGWEGEKRKINLWGEAALFERKRTHDANLGGFSSNIALSFISGADKDLGKNWRGGIAYLHQDFGADRVENFSRVYSSLPAQQGWLFLAGKSYFLINASRELNPLTNFSINGMLNLHDASTLWQPVITLNTGNESDLSIYAWLNTGKRPIAAGTSLILKSEFGSFSTGAGFIFRRYF